MDTYVATPTSRGDLTATRAYDLDQSMEKSFRAPEGHENVFAQARGGRAQTFATPSARRPPAANRPGPAKNEFTPLLRSATTNRAKLLNEKTVGRAAFDKSGKPMAPAASRPDAKWNSHLSLPDMSIDEASDSTSVADSRLHATPTAPTQSSSDPSTPTALPKTSGDEPFDRGNMLTLKEQEVVSGHTTSSLLRSNQLVFRNLLNSTRRILALSSRSSTWRRISRRRAASINTPL